MHSVVVKTVTAGHTHIALASVRAAMEKLAKRKATGTTRLERVVERKAPALAKRLDRIFSVEKERMAKLLQSMGPFAKGEGPGHPFRGNQYTEGEATVLSVKDTEAARLKMLDRLDREVKEANLSKLQKEGYRMMRVAIGDTDMMSDVSEVNGKLAAAISYKIKADGMMHVLFFGSMLKGEGARLIARVEKLADDKKIPVRLTAVRGAVPFYKSRGFEVVDADGADVEMIRRGFKKAEQQEGEDVGALAHDPTRKQKLAKDDSAITIEVAKIMEALKVFGPSDGVVNELTPEMIETFAKAGVISVGQVGIGLDDDMTHHVDLKAVEYAKARGAELVTKISETTRDDLRDIVERGVLEGMSPQALAQEVREAKAFSKHRSMMIARTELAFAHVAGNLEGWRVSKVVSGKQWQASINCCPLCDEMDGVTVGLEEKFLFEEDQIDGPPGHPQCRCDVLPVLFDEGDAA